jgi:uncharacterized protein YndB with AHSA1/START domain
MKKGLTSRTSIVIHAPVAKVWEALTEPELIKQYLFGTEAISDWKVGSSIAYKGVWEGKSYEDKGRILQLVPERLLQSTYWSSMGGLEDKPENYATVTYELEPRDNNTQLTVSSDNIATEKERDHTEKNWEKVLETMKKLLEK